MDTSPWLSFGLEAIFGQSIKHNIRFGHAAERTQLRASNDIMFSVVS